MRWRNKSKDEKLDALLIEAVQRRPEDEDEDVGAAVAARIASLVDEGASPHAIDHEGNPAMILAAYNECAAVSRAALQALLAKGEMCTPATRRVCIPST